LRFKDLTILTLVVSLIFSIVISPISLEAEVELEVVDDATTTSNIEEFIQTIESLPLFSDNTNQDSRLDPRLELYVRSGSVPEGIHSSRNKPSIIVTTSREISIPRIKEQMNVKTIVDLGVGYIFQGVTRSPEKLQYLTKMEGVGKIFGDYLIDYEERETSIPGPQIDQFKVREILEVDRVEEELQIEGTGVVVGVADSGTDFGVADLNATMARDENGFPSSFDPSGHGLALTNHTVQAIGNRLPLSEIDFDIWVSGGLIKFSHMFSDGDLRNLDITGIHPSKSGDYKVGILTEPGELRQFFLCVLVDTKQAGLYDTLYIDFDTSWALTIKYNLGSEGGFLGRLLAGFVVRDIEDFSLADEEPHTWGDPIGNSEILARDLDDDGFADVSAGALSNTLDFGELFSTEGEVIRGIRTDGSGFAVMFDSDSHGTSVAGNVGGRGIQPFTVYDDWVTDTVENTTTYFLPGMARGATVAATRILSGGGTLLGWLWLCGFDRNSETGIWEYTGHHKADIINNSFGESDFEIDGYGNSWDFDTLVIDLLSIPGVVHPSYPGTIFLVSAGNGGPGYGTVTSPASSSASISVGASTALHPFEDLHGPENQGFDEVASWSARGPTSLGTPKPDIVNIGESGFSVLPLWATIGNGSRAYVRFGGTSQAAPLTAGVCALIIEALKKRDGTWTPDTVRHILKSTAKDLGYEAVVQGAGRVDAYRAVQLALGEEESDGTPLFEIYSTSSFETAALLLNDAFIASFGEYNKDNVTFSFSEHPGVSHSFTDTSFFAGRISPGSKTTSIITAQTPSGKSIETVSTLTYEWFTEETLQINTSNVDNSYKLEDHFGSAFLNQFYTSDFAAIYLTYDHEILELYDEQDVEPPIVYLHDWNDLDNDGTIDDSDYTKAIGEVRRITSSQSFANILSMYVGNPKTDFVNDPTIMVQDTGFRRIRPWEGVALSLTIQLYKRVPWTWLTVVQNQFSLTEWTATMTVPSQVTPGIYQGFIKFTKGLAYQLVPVTVSVIDKIPAGPNTLNFGGTTKRPLNTGGVYGSFDWSWRPESGDYRIYNFELTASDAKYLVTDIEWEYEDTVLDVWIIDPSGAIIDTSDIVFVTEGQYNSTTTRATGQILVSPVNKTGIYTIALHSTKFDGQNVPESIAIAMSYLTKELPTPVAKFSVPDGISLEGPHATVSVEWDPISSEQLPYLMITETSISALEGEIINTTGTIDPNEDMLVGGWFETVGETAEDYITRSFQKGDQVQIEVGWTAPDESTDFDIFIWAPGDERSYDENLVGSRLATDDNPEKTTFIAPRDGLYTIGIDWFGGSRFVEYYIYTDNTRGVTNTELGITSTIDTHGTGHNGEFTIRSIAYTGTSVTFQKEITITAENFYPPELTVTFPNGGEIIKSPINITWTASDINDEEQLRYRVFFSPNNGDSWIQLTDNEGRRYVNETYLRYDFAQWKGIVQGIIKVQALDGLFTVEDTSDALFSISVNYVPEYPAIAVLIIIQIPLLFIQFKRKRSKK